MKSCTWCGKSTLLNCPNRALQLSVSPSGNLC